MGAVALAFHALSTHSGGSARWVLDRFMEREALRLAALLPGALKAVRSLAFVGLTELWDASIALSTTRSRSVVIRPRRPSCSTCASTASTASLTSIYTSRRQTLMCTMQVFWGGFGMTRRSVCTLKRVHAFRLTLPTPS